MIPRQGTWSEVEPGMYVRDKLDHVWRIEGARDAKIVLKNQIGQERLLTPPDRNTPVTILEPSHDEAEAIVADKLNATREALSDNGQPFKCARWPSQLGQAKSHLSLMHGMYATDIKSIGNATEAHDYSHGSPDRGYIPHTHGGF